jgi:hypothetical protein
MGKRITTQSILKPQMGRNGMNYYMREYYVNNFSRNYIEVLLKIS